MNVYSHLRGDTIRDDEEEHLLVENAEGYIRMAISDLYLVKTNLAARIGYSPGLNEAIRSLVADLNKVRTLMGKEELDERRAILGETV